MKAAILWTTLAFLYAAYITQPILDTAIFRHLATGTTILAMRSVPVVDQWTVVGAGAAWKSESWLYDALVASIYQLYGFRGIVLLQALLAFAALQSLAAVARSLTGEFFLSSLLALLAVSGMLYVPWYSPDMPGLVLVTVGLWTAVLSLRGSKISLLSFTLTAVLLSNLSVLAYLVGVLFLLPLIWTLPAVAEPDADNSEADFRVGLRVSLSLLVLLAAVVHPYFGTQLAPALRGVMDSFVVSDLRAQAGTVFDFSISFLVLLGLLAAVLAAALFSGGTILAGEKAALLLAVGFGLLAFIVRSTAPWGLLAQVLLLSLLWRRATASSYVGPSPAILEGLTRLRVKLSGLADSSFTGLVWLMLCMGVVLAQQLRTQPALVMDLPVLEVDHLFEELPQGLVVHDRGIGDYLSFRRDPRLTGGPKPLWDMTSPIGAAFDSLRLLGAQGEGALSSLGRGWEEAFRLPQARSALVPVGSALYELLLRDRQWRLTFCRGETVDSAPEVTADAPSSSLAQTPGLGVAISGGCRYSRVGSTGGWAVFLSQVH